MRAGVPVGGETTVADPSDKEQTSEIYPFCADQCGRFQKSSVRLYNSKN